MLPLTPVTKQCWTAMLQQANYVLPKLPVDPVEDGRVLNNLMTWAEHQFPGRNHQNRIGHIAESLVGSMKMIMRTAAHKEAKRVVRLDVDPALVATNFNDMVVKEATEEEEAVVDRQPSKVVLSEKWVSILYAAAFYCMRCSRVI